MQGAQGVQGVQGLKGETGPPGPVSVAYHESTGTLQPAVSGTEATVMGVPATCPAGMAPIGGGGTNEDTTATVVMTDSVPYASSGNASDPPDGWIVYFRNTDMAHSYVIHSDVVCATVTQNAGFVAGVRQAASRRDAVVKR